MKNVLFVCVENSCRSQMAEGFARHYGKGLLQVFSAGSKPSGKVDPDTIKAMQDIGIDISVQKSKGFLELPVKDFDYVITLGCKDACPFVPALKHIDWNIEDPKGKGIEVFKKTRKAIREKIRDFLKELRQ